MIKDIILNAGVFGMPGHYEVLIVLGIILLFFFLPKKLPEFSRSIGQSIVELKKGFKDAKKYKEVEEIKKEIKYPIKDLEK